MGMLSSRALAVLMSAVGLISCGGNSSAGPSSSAPASLRGTWSGGLTFNGTIAQGPVTMELTQAAGAANVADTWSGKNNWSGTIEGSVSGSTFAGQLVWNYTGSGQARSTGAGTAAISGNAANDSMTWTSLSIT